MLLPALCVVFAVLLIARDLIARRRERELRDEMRMLKDGLKHTDRLANVGRLVSGLAQELKSPLQGVLGNAEMLAATGQAEATSQELNEIRENATRAVGIIRNLLVFTEANSLHRRWHNLNDLVTAAVESRRLEMASAGVKVSLDGAPRLPLVYVDGRQMERVITTLLDRWTKEPRKTAATVMVSTQRRSTDERLIVSINDPATSLEDDDPTWSGDLDACRRVLETHGGALEVERLSSGGFGCRLELPVTAAGSPQG